jgi:(p)ppGpp synthase/HD superfamily hydrolase
MHYAITAHAITAHAITAHAGQTYGDNAVPYTEHLFAVRQVLRDFGYFGDYEDAGVLHDVIEDTAESRRTVAVKFGDRVATMAWVCTGVGPNRVVRNWSIYAKMSMFPEAAPVKVADRIANVEQATPGSKHAKMYLAEAGEFHEHVARLVPPLMQARLLRAYDAAAQVPA